MSNPSRQPLRTIRFAGELLPDWAQLLDLASRLCPIPEETRRWFSALTNSHGTDDARTVQMHCKRLQSELQAHREQVLPALQRERQDAQPAQIMGAWLYALDTMLQQASTHPTCSWVIEGMEPTDEDDFSDGGEINLRRV